jgi:hypothetical protein
MHEYVKNEVCQKKCYFLQYISEIHIGWMVS